jgi:hypothetical protein
MQPNSSFTAVGEFARVRLVNADSLYRFLVRPPADSIADTARRTIEASASDLLADPFFREIEGDAIAAWKFNKSFLDSRRRRSRISSPFYGSRTGSSISRVVTSITVHFRGGP